ncbi:MAG: carboxypeptidase regulatory-like domain-containing protein [Saprospiraceae bacterium]|nr:carboxypeptidase regulatory-like domain-containing protein [Saprospiraceae bacterium]
MFCAFCIIHTMFAQQTKTQIQGNLLDAKQTPIAYATVVLMDKDSAFVRGDISKDDGSFIFEKVSPGEYYVSVQSIEFGHFIIAKKFLIKWRTRDTLQYRFTDQYYSIE